ncbi:MAG: hypothetical protein ACLQBD_18395 [Syntrophobacteraceae bacterium]
MSFKEISPCPADMSEIALEYAIEQLFNETRLTPEGVLVSADSHQSLMEIISNPAKAIFYPLRSNIIVIFGFPSCAWGVFNRKLVIYSEGV